MSRNFYAQQDHLGFPIPGTMMFTTAPLPIPKNTFAILPQTYTPGVYQQQRVHPGGIRYFVRKLANGDIIPNTLFLSTTQPAGLWWELKVFYNAPGIHPIGNITTGLDYTGAGPSSTVTQGISFYHIAPGEIVTVSHTNTNFEISTDGVTWTTGSVTYTVGTTDPSVANLYIRLKAGLSVASYTETITLSSHTVVTPVTFSVTGTVS